MKDDSARPHCRGAGCCACLECLAAHEKRPIGDVLADVVCGEPEESDDADSE